MTKRRTLMLPLLLGCTQCYIEKVNKSTDYDKHNYSWCATDSCTQCTQCYIEKVNKSTDYDIIIHCVQQTV